MKIKKFLPALALLLTVVFSFAFRSVVSKYSAKFTCVKEYLFTGNAGTADENDPTKYLDITGDDPAIYCSGYGKVCILCIKNGNLIYTHTEVVNGSLNPAWEGQPKVVNDGAGGNTLDDDIVSAKGITTGTFYSGTNADIYPKQ